MGFSLAPSSAAARKGGLTMSWPGFYQASTSWRQRKAWMPGTRAGMTWKQGATSSRLPRLVRQAHKKTGARRVRTPPVEFPSHSRIRAGADRADGVGFHAAGARAGHFQSPESTVRRHVPAARAAEARARSARGRLLRAALRRPLFSAADEHGLGELFAGEDLQFPVPGERDQNLRRQHDRRRARPRRRALYQARQ